MCEGFEFLFVGSKGSLLSRFFLSLHFGWESIMFDDSYKYNEEHMANRDGGEGVEGRSVITIKRVSREGCNSPSERRIHLPRK